LPIDLEFFVVANAKLQIFGDLPKGLSPFLSTQSIFLSDTNSLERLEKLNIFASKIRNMKCGMYLKMVDV
jgi:hypothetical protein